MQQNPTTAPAENESETEQVPIPGGNSTAPYTSNPAVGKNSDGVYQFNGIIIGHVDLVNQIQKQPGGGYEDPPPGLGKLRETAWIIRHECKFNPLTVFELYISAIGSVWGGFLLAPYNSFDGTGKLWVPVRTLFGGRAGTPWYDSGSEFIVGTILILFHLLHGWAVAHGRAGDTMRRLTVCFLMTLWSCIAVLFFAADPSVPNYATAMVICGFLFAALSAVFRKSGLR